MLLHPVYHIQIISCINFFFIHLTQCINNRQKNFQIKFLINKFYLALDNKKIFTTFLVLKQF